MMTCILCIQVPYSGKFQKGRYFKHWAGFRKFSLQSVYNVCRFNDREHAYDKLGN